VSWFDFIRILCSVYTYKLSQMHRVWQCIHPQEKLYFFFYEINFRDKWYSHLKTPKKKHNVIYDLRFFIAFRTSCLAALCMSNKRVSSRRIFRYAEKIWIVSTAKEGDIIYCRRCNWSLLRHRLVRMAAQLLWMVICPC